MEKYKYSELKASHRLDYMAAYVSSGNTREEDVVPLEMNIEEAKELMGKYFSPIAMPLIPYEIRANKEFMKWAIENVDPVTYPSVFKYADIELKNDPELAIFAIKKHGYKAVEYIGKRLLSDAMFLNKIIDLPELDEYVLPDLAERLVKENSPALKVEVFVKRLSSQIKSNETSDELYKEVASKVRHRQDAIKMVKTNPNSYRYMIPEAQENKEVILATTESMLEKGVNLRTAESLVKRIESKPIKTKEDVMYKKLVETCKKIGELPKNAKIRQKIYTKLAETFIAKINKEKDKIDIKKTTVKM